MQTLFKKTFLKPVPHSTTLRKLRGKQIAVWVGKGGKERTALVLVKSDGTKAVFSRPNICFSMFLLGW